MGKTMTKHTPGPWAINYNGTIGHIKSLAKHPRGMTPTIARFDSDLIAQSIEEDESLANAHLVSAAPDMLAAIQGAMKIVSLWNGRVVPEYHQHYEEMKALEMMQQAFIEAIAKAEGRKLCDKCGDTLTGHEDDSATRCRWCVTCTEVTEGESIAERK